MLHELRLRRGLTDAVNENRVDRVLILVRMKARCLIKLEGRSVKIVRAGARDERDLRAAAAP
jgi:hypothetical protein